MGALGTLLEPFWIILTQNDPKMNPKWSQNDAKTVKKLRSMECRRSQKITTNNIIIISYYLLASPAFHRPQFFNYFGIILGPFWVHFGTNLGPKWVKMAPRAPKSAPRAPQERPRAPKSRFFNYLIISGGSRKAPGALWERPKTLQEPPGTAQEPKRRQK